MNSTTVPSEDLAYKIRIIFPPIMLVFGVPGNVICIIVLCRLRKTQYSTYLVCLAVADLVFLGIWKTFDWLSSVLHLYRVDSDGIICRIQLLGYFSCLQIASWMQVLVTIERVVSVVSPHKVRGLFSTERALTSVVLTSMVIFGLNVSFLIAPARDANFSNGRYCFDNENFRYQANNVWPWIYLSLGYFIPWIALLFGNALIILTLRRNIRHNKSALSIDTGISIRKYKVSIVTKRVIALNIVYNVCVTPICIYSLLSLFNVKASNSELVSAILSALMLVNNSISFFLYIVLGSKFRQEVLKMILTFKCFRNAREPAFSLS